MYIQKQLKIKTKGRGTYDLTPEITEIIQQSKVETGLCHVFIHHTSASLIICENAAPEVLQDLEYFMQKSAPDGDPNYLHNDEGPDDMSAHIRSILTQTETTLPIKNGNCILGIWQGVFLWEHRTSAHTRQITITLQGE
jgi:secondary thiamine-phosphate synthase enzyme